MYVPEYILKLNPNNVLCKFNTSKVLSWLVCFCSVCFRVLVTHWCVHFSDTLSLCSPETLTLKGLSWCLSAADESDPDPLEQWVTTLPNVHKHTYRDLDISGSATQSSLREKVGFFKILFQYIKVLHLRQSLFI